MNNIVAEQFFISGLQSTRLNHQEIKLLKDGLLGVILFKRNIESLAQVVALNQAIIQTKAATIISVDQEGGRVARLRGICVDLPPMLKMKDIFHQEANLCYRLGAMQARELGSLGFNLNFAPVCDILSNDHNQVIGDRAFSNNAHEVAQFISLYINGLQGGGIAACAKHFPGHGHTKADSHYSLPKLTLSREDLINRELLPFKEAIAHNVSSIMTAHIVIENIDKLPATMSIEIIDKILRKDLKYNNIVISDDLEMKAVSDHYSLKEILEHAIMAGVDVFIIGNNLDKTKEAISCLNELINTKPLIKEKLYLAQKRIASWQERYIGKPAIPDLSMAENMVRCQPHLMLANTLQGIEA